MVFGILIFLNKSIGINFGILIFITWIIRIQCIFYTWVFYVKNNIIFIYTWVFYVKNIVISSVNINLETGSSSTNISNFNHVILLILQHISLIMLIFFLEDWDYKEITGK